MRLVSLLAGIALLGGLALSALAQAGQTPNPALVVLEKQDGTLAIVNPATLEVVGRVPVGADPHEVAVSADGDTAYVSNYGFFGKGAPGHTISVVDLVSQKPLPPIDLTPLFAPHGLDFAGGEPYFTAEGSKVIGRYNPGTHKIDWVMGTGQDRTHMLRVFFDPAEIFTANVASGTISIFQETGTPARTDWKATVVPVGRGSEGFDVTRDRGQLWVANADDGTVSIVDTSAKKVIQTFPDSVKHANRLKFTQDGKYALISDLQSDDLTVLSVASRSVYKKIPLGSPSEGILIAPDGEHAYIALGPANAVDVIDLSNWTVSGKIQTGRGPDGMAWAVRR
ncbi:MAG TPA: YncE family protein [Verrucomicrobiae bacterium]|nr:YncE family protein [Verrucomicrobiae bacterium]